MATDKVRQIAFESVYPLAAGEAAHSPGPDGLAPAERELSYQMAIRRLVVQVLYEAEQAGVDDAAFDRFLHDAMGRVEDLGPMAAETARSLASEAFTQRAEADAEFGRLVPDWPPHRQAAVDRAILRVARAELLRGTPPGAVVINEAIELARAFSTDRSPAFINGLLDAVLARLKAQGAKPPAEA